VTPLPSSFIAFDLLKPLWIVVALGSVTLFIGFLLRVSLRHPKIVLPLLVVVASCAPMILIHSSELYSTMIAPFAVSIVLLFGVSKMRWPSLALRCLPWKRHYLLFGHRFNPLGLPRLPYSIYGKNYHQDPTCPIGATAHFAWDGTAASNGPYHYPGGKGRVICIR
jgi:hypothetical protein